MFDPGAMGTLLIGLNANENEIPTQQVRRSLVAPRRERERSVRAALAGSLRRAADRLQPQTVGELAQ
jgi:hypothetical protein